jgi:hypothetical protein
MNMDKFKVGDKVVYKHTGLFGWEKDDGEIDWCVAAGLILGNIYTVKRIGKEVVILSESVAYYLHEDHFELAEADLQERDLINVLVSALEPFARFACSPTGECSCNNCVARDVIKKAKEIS